MEEFASYTGYVYPNETVVVERLLLPESPVVTGPVARTVGHVGPAGVDWKTKTKKRANSLAID